MHKTRNSLLEIYGFKMHFGPTDDVVIAAFKKLYGDYYLSLKWVCSEARNLFDDFIKHFWRFYKRNLTFNVHSMLHLVECVREHGNVESLSAYKCENSIRKLQFYIRKNIYIFSQKSNRLTERETAGLLRGEEAAISVYNQCQKERFWLYLFIYTLDQNIAYSSFQT